MNDQNGNDLEQNSTEINEAAAQPVESATGSETPAQPSNPAAENTSPDATPHYTTAAYLPEVHSLPPTAAPIPTAAKTEHMTKKTLTFLCVFFACLILIITALTYYTNIPTDPNAPIGTGDNAAPSAPRNSFEIPDNLPDSNLQILVEQVSRPALPDESYADKATGLLTSVGVPEFVMPSIALVKVYGDDVYSLLGTGSGVIMSSNGYIITNAHVLEGGTQFSVQLASGEIYEAKAVGTDSKQDVGVLKIEAEGLTPAVFGKSDDVKLGEEVAVVASAGQNLADMVTYGNVSNTNRKVTISGNSTVECLQIDAALNPGNSGGPVVNMYGQVIGIVDAKKAVADSATGMNLYEGIGFVLKVDTVLETAESIIEYGYSQTSVRVGILYVAIDDYSASYYGVPSGLLVEEIDPACDIANSGLQVGDIITAIDGKKVLSPESIYEVTAGKRPGDTATIDFVRKDLAENVTSYSSSFVYAPVASLPSNESYAG
jgi:serine protease Do